MSRCVACNDILTDYELAATRFDGRPEDMCVRCRRLGYFDPETATEPVSLEEWHFNDYSNAEEIADFEGFEDGSMFDNFDTREE